MFLTFFYPSCAYGCKKSMYILHIHTVTRVQEKQYNAILPRCGYTGTVFFQYGYGYGLREFFSKISHSNFYHNITSLAWEYNSSAGRINFTRRHSFFCDQSTGAKPWRKCCHGCLGQFCANLHWRWPITAGIMGDVCLSIWRRIPLSIIVLNYWFRCACCEVSTLFRIFRCGTFGDYSKYYCMKSADNGICLISTKSDSPTKHYRNVMEESSFF